MTSGSLTSVLKIDFLSYYKQNTLNNKNKIRSKKIHSKHSIVLYPYHLKTLDLQGKTHIPFTPKKCEYKRAAYKRRFTNWE